MARAAAIDQAAQLVPAKVVCAENMLCAGRDHGTAGILIIISVWCDLIGENCDENEKDQNDQSHQRLLVLFKTSPDFGEHTVIFHAAFFSPLFLKRKNPLLELSYMVFMRGSINV